MAGSHPNPGYTLPIENLMSAEAIAERGHIVTQLRAFMEANNLTPADVNIRLGRDRGGPSVYGWLKGSATPGPQSRRKLAKLTGTKPSDWETRPVGQTTKQARQIARAKPPGTALMPHTPASPVKREVLGFMIDSEGAARLKFDVTVPAERGVKLLQMLLSAGFLLTESIEPS